MTEVPVKFYSYCSSCDRLFCVTGTDSDKQRMLGMFGGKYGCPYCDGAAIELEPTIAKEAAETYPPSHIDEMSIEEFVRAISGAGLPGPLQPTYDLVTDLFTNHTLVSVSLRNVPSSTPPRVVVDKFKFSNGLVAYLGQSAYGAVIYQIVDEGQGNG